MNMTRVTGKRYLKYYDENGTLLKAKEIRAPLPLLFQILLWIFIACVAIIVLVTIYLNMSSIIFLISHFQFQISQFFHHLSVSGIIPPISVS